ncbi:MAG: PqqD family protein [Pseudomonadota bacterium]
MIAQDENYVVSKTWVRRKHCFSSIIDDSCVVLNSQTGEYLTLNKTAAEIWEALEFALSVGELTEILVEKFDVSPEKCEADVIELIGSLSSAQLIYAIE